MCSEKEVYAHQLLHVCFNDDSIWSKEEVTGPTYWLPELRLDKLLDYMNDNTILLPTDGLTFSRKTKARRDRNEERIILTVRIRQLIWKNKTR